MASRFENFKAGVVDDNPLLVGAVTLTSSGLSQLQTITAPDWAYLVLDPDGSAGAPEVVKVTNHASSATTATITRAQDGTTARQHLLNTVWRHSLVKADIDELPFRKVTTKGDILAATAANTISRVAAGADGTFLQADAASANGVRYIQGTKVEVFTAGGTWTKATGAVGVSGVVVGSGGGGGSGRRGATGGGGGGGGGGGEITRFAFDASLLAGTETITIGAGGTAGAAQTVNDTNGNAGGAGNSSSIGTKVVARGGGAGSAGAGGGTISGFSGAGGSGVGVITFSELGQGAPSSATDTVGKIGGSGNGYTAPGGGAGGGTGAGTDRAGGNGGSAPGAAGGAGGAAGTNVGAVGTAATANSGLPGGAAGGGGGSGAAAGGAGGVGGLAGGGAGGGGGGANGFNSGAGGVGGAGIVIIITDF